jgi:hypothetical protein
MSDLKVDGITAATANTAVTIKGLGTGKVVLGDGNLVFPDADGAAGTFITTNGSAALSFAAAGKVVQIVTTPITAVVTGTGTIPHDDTIPQNSEGAEFFTLAITPTSASTRLQIDVVYSCSSSIANRITGALFQDSTANALSCAAVFESSASVFHTTSFSHNMVSGTTSATTFKLRIGQISAATITLNGRGGARLYGGTFASSMTITEYTP